MLRFSIQKETFIFKQPSGTSRGVLTEKHAWFIHLWEENAPQIIGLGECSVIPDLSPDFKDFESYETKIKELVVLFIEQQELTKDLHSFYKSIEQFPSILFGIEMAYLDLKNDGKALFFDTDFTLRQKKIPINGLIWMGDKSFIEKQIEEKLAQGYTCLKMKVGAINFETEFEILAALRQHYPKEKLILRVDANGAFSVDEALEKLNRLATLDIHSIEQPIKQGQAQQMAELCQTSLLPIALDEELIDITETAAKKALLESIKPPYIILKPSLHGGFTGCREWIQLAEAQNIHWWMTSALESNVGLNAIAQFASCYDLDLHQGLGTGSLYVTNTPTKLKVEGGFVWFDDLD